MSRFGKFVYQELVLFMAGLSALQEKADIDIGILKLKGELYEELCERKMVLVGKESLEQSIKYDTLKSSTGKF